MDKIKMTTPLVEMDGDEMTRILWKMIKDELLEPFIELNTEYYDLGFKKRAIECLSFEDYKKLFEYYKDYETSTHCCQHLDIEKFVVEMVFGKNISII